MRKERDRQKNQTKGPGSETKWPKRERIGSDSERIGFESKAIKPKSSPKSMNLHTDRVIICCDLKNQDERLSLVMPFDHW